MSLQPRQTPSSSHPKWASDPAGAEQGRVPYSNSGVGDVRASIAYLLTVADGRSHARLDCSVKFLCICGGEVGHISGLMAKSEAGRQRGREAEAERRRGGGEVGEAERQRGREGRQVASRPDDGVTHTLHPSYSSSAPSRSLLVASPRSRSAYHPPPPPQRMCSPGMV